MFHFDPFNRLATVYTPTSQIREKGQTGQRTNGPIA